MTRKGESITLSISKQQKGRLEGIALAFGQTWGDSPNVSALIKAIADDDGPVKVVWANSLKGADLSEQIETAREELAQLKREKDEIIKSCELIQRGVTSSQKGITKLKRLI